MGHKETDLQNRVRAVVNMPGTGCRVWRNNVGKRKIDGRWISWGLAPGSADLIGIKQVQISTEMVGSKIAIFTSLEIKTLKGVEGTDQIAWRDTVLSLGGIAEFIRSEADAIRVLGLSTRPA